MTIMQLLEDNARRFGRDIALVEINPEVPETRRITWREYDLVETDRAPHYRREISWAVFNEKANRFANALASRGVRKGDKVAILLMNCLEWLPIYFGVLTFLGVTSLIAVPAEKLLSRVPPAAGLAVSSVLFVATYRLNRGKLLFFSLPRSLYANLFTAFFGFPYKGFSSSDYFPLFPWIFLFYAGYFLYGILTAKGKTLYAGKKNMLSFIGKHTLPVYMLHQPIIYAVLSLLDRYSLL